MRVLNRLLTYSAAIIITTHRRVVVVAAMSLPVSKKAKAAAAMSTSIRTTSSTAATAATTTTTTAITSLDLSTAKGEFQRNDAQWRHWVRADGSSDFPAAGNGRYHLYVAYACPWAHRTLLVRALKGLETAISVTIVHPIWQRTRPDDPTDFHSGWIFGRTPNTTTATTTDDTSTPTTTTITTLTNSDGNGGPFPLAYPDNEPDPYSSNKNNNNHNAMTTIRNVYERALHNNKDSDNGGGGVYSVPILYDTIQKTIVNNESSEIIRMFNSEFNAYSTTTRPNNDAAAGTTTTLLDLYPESLRTTIDTINSWVYPTINNGVYRCGFAKSQDAYNVAIAELTASLDRVEDILQTQRYLAGDCFTEADIRLFVTLLRLDEVYIVYFKCNTRSVEHSDAMLNYCREIYQMPRVKETVNMEQIKTHYFASHPRLNYYSIIPAGRDFIKLLEQPHNRHNM